MEKINKKDKMGMINVIDIVLTDEICFCPQQRKLMGSSAQISSRVCRCGSQEQVPEEGSGRFRKLLESSGACWCRFRRQVPEGSGGFRRMLV